jgi:hypothetical protein
VKFLVTSGNAAAGREATEEVLDAVTFGIEILVKGGLFALLGRRAMTATPPS